jgi:hypothetical protein
MTATHMMFRDGLAQGLPQCGTVMAPEKLDVLGSSNPTCGRCRRISAGHSFARDPYEVQQAYKRRRESWCNTA